MCRLLSLFLACLLAQGGSLGTAGAVIEPSRSADGTGNAADDTDENEEESREVARIDEALQALQPGAVEQKTALLDKLAGIKTIESDRVLARLMEHDKDDPVRVRAFCIWAERYAYHIVAEFLDGRRNTASFGIYLSALPQLKRFESLRYLKGVYSDENLIRHRKLVLRIMTDLDSDDAFDFLEKRWQKTGSSREAFELTSVLLAMKKGQSPAFTKKLLKSRHAFARLEGAKRLLEAKGGPDPDKVAGFFQAEADPRCRRGLLDALARLRTGQAAAMIIAASDTHPKDSLHEIVTVLSSMPPGALRNAVPDDLFLERKPMRFQVIALALASSDRFSDLLDREEMQILKSAMKDPCHSLRLVAIAAYGRMTGRESLVRLKIEPLFSPKTPDISARALDAVRWFHLRDETIVRKVRSLVNSKEWELKVMASRAVGVLKEQKALPLLTKNLSSQRLLVRIAASKALGCIGGKGSVSALVDRLRREEGRAAWEIARSLQTITGRNFGVDAGQWKRWWKTSIREALPPAAQSDPWSVGGPQDSRYGFYGLSFESHHVTYVLDVSNSMSGARLKRLKEELTRTIRSLTPVHMANMIFFNSSVRVWKESLVAMERNAGGGKDDALKTVQGIKAGGNTNIYGALKAAFKDEEVDAIILLTDGDPTAGAVRNKAAIIEAVISWNRTQQAVLHVVAVGQADRSFMQKLAAVTGGTFVSL